MFSDAVITIGSTELAWPWFSGIVAFLVTLLATPAVIRLAHRRGWVAQPKADRWHARPTALMGGIAIYAGAGLCLIALASEALPWSIALGATIMFVTGLVDDLVNIRPATKLAAQVLAAGVLVVDGFTFGVDWPAWIGIPITLFWLIGITNALNLLDNMDGLAAGIAGIAAMVLALLSSLSGDLAGFSASMAVAGATAAFLVFNFKPARVFMGDSGSLFLGYMIAAMSLVAQANVPGGAGLGVTLVSIFIVAVPIFDTTLVTIVRKRSGRAISQGGRDHSSHRLVFLGLSERRAVVTLYVIGLVFGLGGLITYVTAPSWFVGVSLVLAVPFLLFGVFLARADVYGKQPRPSGAAPRPDPSPELSASAVAVSLGILSDTLPARPTRVVFYGAGETALQLLQEIRQNADLGLVPVGFIDDDPRKHGMVMHGVPVLGSFRDLERIISTAEPEAVLITAHRMTQARKAEICAACTALGVACRVLPLSSRSLAEQATSTTVVDL